MCHGSLGRVIVASLLARRQVVAVRMVGVDPQIVTYTRYTKS